MRMTAQAVAQALSDVRVIPDFIPMVGGLDVETAPLQREPGTCRAAQNYECTIKGGYRRIAGYERTDGRPSPSDATYAIIQATITGSASVGDTLTGASSGATGVIIALPGGSFVITKVTGTFQNPENLNVGGPTIAASTSLAITNGASTSLLHATYKNLAADQYRSDIAAPTGSGNCLGGFYHNNVNYTFRNNAGGTAAGLFKSSSSGWTAVDLGEQISFTAGSGDIDEGDTLTQGGVTATVKRVVITSGTLGAGTAAGKLILSGRAGGNYAGGAATTTGAGALTLSAVQTAITLLPDGRFETVKHNFGGSANTTRVYGCDGVNKAWEFDGTVFVPIDTGMTSDAPSHITAHKKHLFLSFVGSVQHSSIGNPYVWSAVTGAAELGMGDTVTGFSVQPGSVDGGALAIFSRNRLKILYGSSSSDWNLVEYREELGAFAHTIQDVGFTVFLDDNGLTDIQTSQSYGNFAHNAFSNRVRSTVNSWRTLATASAVSRDRSQYRIFFSSGYALYATVVGRKVVGIMPVLFPDVVRCAWRAEKNDGTEVMYFGSDAGMVYQMEKGTSFDGDAIEYYINLAYNFQKSPRVEKHYRDATLEVEGSGYAAFSFGYALGYGSAYIPQPASSTVVTDFSSVFWDAFTWDAAFWDGITLAPSNLDIGGDGENISLAVLGTSDMHEPFTLTGALIHYSPRRQMRP